MISSGDKSHHFTTASIGCCFFLPQTPFMSRLNYGRPHYACAFLGSQSSEIFLPTCKHKDMDAGGGEESNFSNPVSAVYLKLPIILSR